MHALKLLIADKDEDCIDALSDYFSHEKRDLFGRVMVLSSSEGLVEYLTKNTVDILLTSVEMYKEVQHLQSFKASVLFMPQTIPHGFEDLTYVNPLISAELICDQLRKEYIKSTMHDPEFLEKANRAQILAVFSVAGGIGKSTIAQGICNQMAAQGKATLYINLEEVSAQIRQLKQEMDFSDVICEVLKDKGNIGAVAHQAQVKSELGYFYFESPRSITEMEDLTLPNVLKLLNSLKFCGHYQRIVIDMPTAFSPYSREILMIVDRVLLIGNYKPSTINKLKAFEDTLRVIDGKIKNMDGDVFLTSDFISKCIYLINDNYYTKDGTSKQLMFSGLPVSKVLPFDSKIASCGVYIKDYKFAESLLSLVNQESL